tara:strand:+ start:8271 stop:8609 length:339 start_codon:yes stop_codon:yes gene_type:complete
MEFPPTCIIKFTATWCGPCKAIHPFLEQCGKDCDIPVCVVDVDEYGSLAEEYQVTSIPHMEFRYNGETQAVIKGANKEKIFQEFQNLKKKKNQISLPTLKEAELKNGRDNAE